LIEDLGEAFYVALRSFHRTPAVEICGPGWSLRQGFGCVFVEHSGHERDQVADDARVLDEIFDNRIGESRLFEVEVARRCGCVGLAGLFGFVGHLIFVPTAANKRQLMRRCGDAVHDDLRAGREMFVANIAETDSSLQFWRKYRGRYAADLFVAG